MTHAFGSWKVFSTLRSKAEGITLLNQQHQGQFRTIKEAKAREECDAVVLGREDCVGISTADCLPVIITTPEYAYAIHISRHTLLSPMLEEVHKHIGSKQIDGIYYGPCICSTHFVFPWQDESVKKFMAQFPKSFTEEADGVHLDVLSAAKSIFANWPVSEAHVIEDTHCTYDDLSIPSYKRWLDQGKPGELDRLVTAVRTSTS